MDEMTVVAHKNDFKVWFNGSKTYMVVDNNGDCWARYSSEKSAIKYMDKVA